MEPAVQYQARAAASQAPHLGHAELYQQGALLALEALRRWRKPDGSPRAYVSAVVRRGLRSYTERASWSPDPVDPLEPDQLAGWEPDTELDPVDLTRMRRSLRGEDPALVGWLVGYQLDELASQLGVTRRTAARRRDAATARIRAQLVR